MTAGAASVAKVSSVVQTSADTTSVVVQVEAVLGASKYSFEMSDNGGSYTEVSTSYDPNEKTIYSLAAGKTYFLRVRAMKGTEYGPYSDPIKVATVPNDVTNLRQTDATTSSATFKWDKVSGATGYRICEWVNDQEYVVGTTSSDSYTIKGLNNKIKFPYTVYVRPVRTADGYTAEKTASYSWSNAHISDYNIMLIPKAPSVQVTNYWSNIKEISASVKAEIPFAKGYQYVIYNNKGKKINTLTNTSIYSVYAKNLSRNQFYSIKARAYTNIGNNKTAKYGKWSKEFQFALGTQLSAKPGYKKIALSWNKVKGAKDYTVYISKSKNTGYKKTATVKGTSFTAKKIGKKALKSGKMYYCYVVANKKVGKKTYHSSGNDVWYAKTT